MGKIPLNPGRIALLVLSTGVFFFALFSISAFYFLWEKGGDVYNFYASSFELGVLITAPIVLAWFLFRTNITRLSYWHLSAPFLFVLVAVIVALLYPYRALDSETETAVVTGMGFLYLVVVGFWSLLRRIDRSVEAQRNALSSKPRSTIIPPTLFTYLAILIILLIGVWLTFSWLTMNALDPLYDPSGIEPKQIGTDLIYLLGAPLPLYIALVVLVSPMFFPMAEGPRRDLYWILASFGTVVVLLGTLLTVLAFIDEPRSTIFPLLALATVYGWGIWVMIALFRFLYPLPKYTVTRQSNHRLVEE